MADTLSLHKRVAAPLTADGFILCCQVDAPSCCGYWNLLFFRPSGIVDPLTTATACDTALHGAG